MGLGLMRFPAHWAMGRHGPAMAWGWSDVSPADARAQADARARRIADALRMGRRPGRVAGYYPDRPMREPVLRELTDAAGATLAVISRNAYGAEVLNASDALFADVDLPPPRRLGLLDRLFGRATPDPGAPAPEELAALGRARSWVEAHPGWSWRVYRTAAGLRLLATHRTFDPADPMVAAAFAHLGVDPLYRRLCQAQSCFRARLTPKPWRVGIPTAPPTWPWTRPEDERTFAAWDRTYREASAARAGCSRVETIGPAVIPSDMAELVALHDAVCKVGSYLPLA